MVYIPPLEASVKIISATIRPEALVRVQEALGAVEVFRLTVSDVRGIAGAGAAEEQRVLVEIAVNESFVDPTLRALLKSSRSDPPQAGDGKIFVQELADAVRIRTGERGPEAI